MITDTKTAIAINSFLNFVARTFESYIEMYPVFGYKHIIKLQNELREDSTLREKKRKEILMSSDQKKMFILRETTKLSKQIDEKMEKEVSSVENDLICSFKKAVTKSVNQDLLEAYRKKVKKT